MKLSRNRDWRVIGCAVVLTIAPLANATEGALGRPVAGTSVVPSAGMLPPAPLWVISAGEVYLDGSISGGRQVPIAGRASTGLDADLSLTLATVLKVWDTGAGPWNFASSITPTYAWTKVTASVTLGNLRLSEEESASNLFDLYFTPIIAGYRFSETDNIALSFNVWAPTGKYDSKKLANTSLNNWTFIPQVAYTRSVPGQGLEFDAVAGVQFYTRNVATDYQNAPLVTLDLMGLKRSDNGVGVGLIVGTVQQLGKDSGPLAERLDGFVGRDWAAGPILTYDTKLSGKAPLSLSIRWVPTVRSKNRLESNSTVMATVALIF